MVTLDLVSEAGNYSPYELEDDQATLLTVNDPNRTMEVLLGKKASSGGTYGRFPSQRGVYTFRGDWNQLLPENIQDLRSKQVMSLDSSSVSEITLIKGDKEILLTLDGETWKQDGEDFTFSDDIKNQLNSFTSLNCSSYAEQSSEETIMEIRIGSDWLKIHEKRDDGYLASSSQSMDPFILFNYQAEELLGLFE
jgi:hypothetical protein